MRNRYIKWNLSRKARDFADADIIIVSFPKSGRTWIRVFIDSYFAFSMDKGVEKKNFVPELMFTHDLQEHETSRFWDRIRGKYQIPSRIRQIKPILLIARDPRDVIVSLYFQLNRRDHVYNGTISEMIRDPLFGINSMIEIMNEWISEWGARENFKLVHYEHCKTNTEKAFKDMLQFIVGTEINLEAFTKALDFSSFDNMKKLEGSGKFDSRILQPGDADDPESFKVRKGQIGGFKEYLDKEDISYLNMAVEGLDPRYGYK